MAKHLPFADLRSLQCSPAPVLLFYKIFGCARIPYAECGKAARRSIHLLPRRRSR
jgi:hypothetical protein